MKPKKKNSSLLIPITDLCHIPQLDNVAKLANNSNLKVHVAGFLSSKGEPNILIEKTMRLMRVLKVVLHRLKVKVKNSSSTTSKIYSVDQPKNVHEMIKNNNVKLVVSRQLNHELLEAKRDNSDVILLQLSKNQMANAAEPAITGNPAEDKKKSINKILELFKKNQGISESRMINDLEESFETAKLKKHSTSKEIMTLIKEKEGSCIAMAFDRIEENKEVLDQEKTSVVIY